MVNKISKLLLLTLTSFFLCTNVNFSNSFVTAEAASSFANGADIGWVSQLESNDITWLNDSGNADDPLAILKAHGVDSVRLRVFVNPASNGMWYTDDGYTCMIGFCDKNSVVSMAKRAKKLGFKIMIDFHYSDYFADPSRQDIPAAWSNHNFSQLKTDVYNHTYEVMSALAKENIYPEWVQVGNETNSGMLWPSGYIWGSGSTANTNNWAQLINEGYNAVKKVSSSSKVIIHLADGQDNALFRNVFDSLKNSGAKYDVIGMSYYPYWAGVEYTDSISALEYNLNDMAYRYNKEVMICEVGGLASNSTDSYNLVKTVIEKVKAVPNSKGIGVFYWEPCAASTVVSGGYPLGACIEISSKTLKFNDAINAFNTSSTFPNTSDKYKIVNRLSGKVLNVSGGSGENNAVIEQYDYYGWTSQKWQLVSSGNGYYSIKNVASGKVIDISSKSTSDGASCIQYTNNNGTNQQWSFTKTWDSYYKIINRNSSKLLDINASSTENGASTVQWSDNNGWNQQWIFIEVK